MIGTSVHALVYLFVKVRGPVSAPAGQHLHHAHRGVLQARLQQHGHGAAARWVGGNSPSEAVSTVIRVDLYTVLDSRRLVLSTRYFRLQYIPMIVLLLIRTGVQCIFCLECSRLLERSRVLGCNANSAWVQYCWASWSVWWCWSAIYLVRAVVAILLL